MTSRDWLTERFEKKRQHLRAVAYRMLGSLSEADDPAQEAWLRLSRSESSTIENLDGWRWEQPEKADQTSAACCRSPVYSPDGTEILFPGHRLSNTFDHLFEMNPMGAM
jgi:hypothetical protein